MEGIGEMEGIREIARSFYDRANQVQKQYACDFFKKLDIYGDGKITFHVMKSTISSSLSSELEDTFRKLDKDGDGKLDFDDVLCLYYMEKKTSVARCRVCCVLLGGPYFSCMLCFEKPAAYNLCCVCYRKKDLSHQHSFDNMVDYHSLIKTQREKEMEELHKIAKAHYLAGSREVQKRAREFYESMDTNGDWRINLSEFITFTRDEGYTQICNPYFFEELDFDGNGTLDFDEVMTLYYIIKSGRPFCNDCRRFIPGIYFSCVECFKNPRNSFHLCYGCYQSGKCSHNHNGRAQFLDNYTMLQTKRDPILSQPPGQNLNQTSPSNALVPIEQNNIFVYGTFSNTYVVHHPNHVPNQANAIVPASKKSKLKIALHAFETALSIGSISSTLCTIL